MDSLLGIDPTKWLQYGASGFAALLGMATAALLYAELRRDVVRRLAVKLCIYFMVFTVVLIILALEAPKIVDTVCRWIDGDPKSFVIVGKVIAPPDQEDVKISCQVYYPLFNLTSDRDLNQKLYEDQAVYNIKFTAGDFRSIKTVSYAKTTVDEKNKKRICDLGVIELTKPFRQDSNE